MLKYIVLLTSFFVFFSCGSSKNSSSIPENAPEWVSKTPLSNFNYIGIGMAPKSSSDYREKAQKMESGRSLTIPTVHVHMKMRHDNSLLNNEKFKETRQHTIASMGY